MPGEGYGARPDHRPVRQPFVEVEIFLVYKRVSRIRMCQAIRLSTDLHASFVQTRTAREAGSQVLQFVALYRYWFLDYGGGFVGFTVLALGLGELGDTVASEDLFEGDAGFVPDLAGNTERRVFDVADAARATSGGPDFAVQNLHDIQNGEFFGRHGEAVSTVSPAPALQNAGPTEVAEDLLQKTLRYVLAAGYLCDAERPSTFVQCQLDQARAAYLLFCVSLTTKSPT